MSVMVGIMPYSAAGERNVTAGSLSHIGRIAERHPGLRLTLDHLGGWGGDRFNDRKYTRGSVNHTVPTLPERQGDFSDLTLRLILCPLTNTGLSEDWLFDL
jgi:hypothetical protein